MSDGCMHVIRPGLLTTIQDLGRWGYQASGVPVAGPMDDFSHRLANLLVGNPRDAATLEVTLIGPELEFDVPAVVAVSGADFDVTCNGQPIPMNTSTAIPGGARLAFGRRAAGARAYLAVSGGVRTNPLLGSRATHLVSAMGGIGGRALVGGDRLPIGASFQAGTLRRAPGIALPNAGRARLRIVPGPQNEWFRPQASTTLTSVSFRVSPRSNRMGYRLEGPPLPRQRDDEPIS
ncbi:MAG: biotin-dependent carboxyltransferase family protein, partial [Vicinamibacterales bacterium]